LFLFTDIVPPKPKNVKREILGKLVCGEYNNGWKNKTVHRNSNAWLHADAAPPIRDRQPRGTSKNSD